MPGNPTTDEPFYVPVDLGHTALLLADIQDQIASRFSEKQLAAFTAQVLRLLTLLREEISHRRNSDQPQNARARSTDDLYDGVPLIIHHVFPVGINSNTFISPYIKLARWFGKLEASGAFTRKASDPNTP